MAYPWFPLAASTILAVIPVTIWLWVIRQAAEAEKRAVYIKTFLLGTLAVIPPFILIFLFERFPSLNFYDAIAQNIANLLVASLLTNGIVGAIEEIAKNAIVRVSDKRHPEYFQTISSTLALSICAGLGFAFAENIFYFYNIWTSPEFGATDLFATFIFRSAFTMAGHMIFSGIFGYYFGLGKFAAELTEYSHWRGGEIWLPRLISRITGRMTFESVRMLKNLQGLILAMVLHAGYNVSLDMGRKLPPILIIAFSGAFIAYLLRRKTGRMLFSMVKRRGSEMANRDEETVLELIGMMTHEGKTREVIEICDRLLQRDPDNNVVKLFKARAQDNERVRALFGALKIAAHLAGKNPNSKGAKTIVESQFGKENSAGVISAIERLFKD